MSGFTFPFESSVGKIDVEAQKFPNGDDLFALSDRVGGDEGAENFFVPNEFGRLEEPSNDVVERLKIFVEGNEVVLLRGVLVSFADEGRVADDEVGIRTNGLPVDAEGVTFVNVGIRFEGEEIQVAVNDLAGLLNHLEFGNPQSSLSNGNGEVINFNAEKLRDRNFDGVEHFAEVDLVAEKFFKDFVFETAEAKERFSKEVAGAASGIENFNGGKFFVEGK